MRYCPAMRNLRGWLSIMVLALAGCGGGGSDGDGGPSSSDGSGQRDAPLGPDAGPRNARVFDHAYADLSAIPSSCIEGIKSSAQVFHYAHRSHGSQLIVGAESLESAMPTYGFN